MTGEQERVPVNFELPRSLDPGNYQVRARATFGTGEIQQDSFAIHVLPIKPAPRVEARLALFDPDGKTREPFSKLGLQLPISPGQRRTCRL